MTDPSLIFQAHPHFWNMNQNYKDTSKKSIGNFFVKEIIVPKDVGKVIESLTSKTKEVGSTSYGNVKSNITMVEPIGGMFVTKKIMITNLNPKKIRKIGVVVAELMESSDSSDYELDVDCLN